MTNTPWSLERYHSFVRLVSIMREAQDKYFKTHDHSALRKAKALELRVDQELAKYSVSAPEDMPAEETLPLFQKEEN